jgi:hypothetical protein
LKCWLQLPAHWFCNYTNNNTEMWQIPTLDWASSPFTQPLHSVLDHVGSQPHLLLPTTLFVILNNPHATTHPPNYSRKTFLIQEIGILSITWCPLLYTRVRFS